MTSAIATSSKISKAEQEKIYLKAAGEEDSESPRTAKYRTEVKTAAARSASVRIVNTEDSKGKTHSHTVTNS
jgi:hypothetical protein